MFLPARKQCIKKESGKNERGEIEKKEMTMLRLKKISVNLALIVSLAAWAGVQSAQAEDVSIPLPTEDPGVQAVVDDIRNGAATGGIDVMSIVRQTRDQIKVQQAKLLPLRFEMGKAVSDVVSNRVREETRNRTMQAQMAAMMDPANPNGIPDFIAPKFGDE